MTLLIKLLLTVVVVFIGLRAIFANVVVAGRTAEKMKADLGISEQEARHRTTPIVFGWALVILLVAAGLIWLIW